MSESPDKEKLFSETIENSETLVNYLNDGIKRLVKNALRETAKNPKETAFFLRYALSAKKAESLRKKTAKKTGYAPSFLIASIASRCNLNCAGCYNRARKDSLLETELTRSEWGRIFKEASELGVCVVILAGGEPFMRRDVLEEASMHKPLLFPVFTNGTMMDESYLELFEKNRNLIPVFSIEGDEDFTDSRRGQGIFSGVTKAMENLKNADLFFGVSITVTERNLNQILLDETISRLKDRGCKIAVYVEYVPVSNQELVISDEGRKYLEKRIAELRKRNDFILFSFPGDEKKSGGCLAAGRGFFHISTNGGAEPCPFSPFSDLNVKNISLREALESPLFSSLRNGNFLNEDHKGGCALFGQDEKIKSFIQGAT